MRLKVLDLFSGIGGFSLGLERAGFETVAFCENDEHCQKVLNKHWPYVKKFNDVTKLKYKNGYLFSKDDKLRGYAGEIDVICGGFPCQDISVAGKKKGFKDELEKRTRSGLWEEFARIIKEVEPQFAIIENVANLRNIGLNQVIKDLWKIGYACEWHIISARSIGACHLRERIWIIAYPNGKRLEGSREELQLAKNERKAPVNGVFDDSTHTNVPRFWKPFASEEEKSEWWSETTSGFRDWWQVESSICRMDDGLSPGLDKSRVERIKQLGNSIVPQIAELIGRELLK